MGKVEIVVLVQGCWFAELCVGSLGVAALDTEWWCWGAVHVEDTSPWSGSGAFRTLGP